MARGRDLAGLAALAGLAYMANRKNKEEPQNLGADSGAISPEDAAMGARGNAEMARMAALDNPDFEPGMYTKEPGGDSAPAPARAAPTRSAAKAPAARPNIVSREEGMKNYVPRRKPPANTASSSEEGMKNYVPRRAPAANPDYSNEGRTYEPKAKAKAKYETPYDRMNRENREAGIKFKKGGAVKKMASGGMTSASKRADGIASRGKTKCKMY